MTISTDKPFSAHGYIAGTGEGTADNPFVPGDYPATSVRLVDTSEEADLLDDIPCRAFQVITAGIVEIYPLRNWDGSDNPPGGETPLTVDLAGGAELPAAVYPIMCYGFTSNTTATILAYR